MSKNTNLMKIINIYLVFTILYYYIGRYSWNIPSNIKLLTYVLLLIIAMNVGYYSKKRLVLYKPRIINNIYYETTGLSNKTRKIFVISCLSIIIFQVAWVITVLGQFNVNNILSSLGNNYYDRLSYSNEDSVLIMQLRTLFWGISLFAYPIGFTLYKKLKVSEKTLFLVTLCIDILASLNMGISKNIGDIVLIYILCVVVGKQSFEGNIIKSTFIRYRKIIFLICAFAIIFGVIQHIRDNSNGMAVRQDNPYHNFSELREYTIFDIVFLDNQSLISVVDKLGAYVSHGYTGLAYSLELPFQNTYGIGFSRALIEYAEQYFNIDVNSATYMERIEALYGWPNGMYWPTAFTWLASAFSFWLLPFIMCLYGHILARVERRYRLHGDIFSLTLLAQLFIMAIYLPANAQIFQSRQSLFGILFIGFIYVITRRRYKT